MVIEHTFGPLKGRFRRLKYLDMLDLQKAVKIFMSCCALQELCLSRNYDLSEFIEEGMTENVVVNNFVEIHNPPNTAEMKRHDILDMI